MKTTNLAAILNLEGLGVGELQSYEFKITHGDGRTETTQIASNSKSSAVAALKRWETDLLAYDFVRVVK